jgi:hypothetical protein
MPELSHQLINDMGGQLGFGGTATDRQLATLSSALDGDRKSVV